MCDCYYAKCECCDRMLDIHIADFCMPRENVAVYCWDHLPAGGRVNGKPVFVFKVDMTKYKEEDDRTGDTFEECPPDKWKVGIVIKDWGYGEFPVTPNVGFYTIMEA